MSRSDALQLDAAVTISRPSGATGDRIRLSVVDKESRGTIVEAQLSLADFALAVTGRGDVDARAEVWPGALARLGMVRENDTRLVALGKGPSTVQAALDAVPGSNFADLVHTYWCTEFPGDLADGWALFGVDERPNPHRWVRPEHPDLPHRYRINVERYVDPTEEESS